MGIPSPAVLADRSGATEIAYFIGFFVLSAGAGLVIGYVRWMSAESSYYLSVLVVYVGASPQRFSWPTCKRLRSRSWR